jgi:hypothetical protein
MLNNLIKALINPYVDPPLSSRGETPVIPGPPEFVITDSGKYVTTDSGKFVTTG